jgi:hypothetical protein
MKHMGCVWFPSLIPGQASIIQHGLPQAQGVGVSQASWKRWWHSFLRSLAWLGRTWGFSLACVVHRTKPHSRIHPLGLCLSFTTRSLDTALALVSLTAAGVPGRELVGEGRQPSPSAHRWDTTDRNRGSVLDISLFAPPRRANHGFCLDLGVSCLF